MATVGSSPPRAEMAALEAEVRRLSLLVEATRSLHSTLDLEALLQLILQIARRQIPAERGSVFLLDAERGEIWSLLAEGRAGEAAAGREIRLPLGRGVTGHVAATGEAINTADPYAEPRFDARFDRASGFVTRSLLCVPIRGGDGRVVGALELLNHAGGAFSPADEAFLADLSQPMALALENAQLHRAALEKERLQRELELGREIQRGLLPAAPPRLAGAEIAVWTRPYFPVSGDYYDFIPSPRGGWTIVLADVEGKGVAAALVMSQLQAWLRALAGAHGEPAALAAALNPLLTPEARGGKYATLFLAALAPEGDELRFVNAGQTPPLLLRADGSAARLETGGTVVGLLPDARYDLGRCRVGPGDVLLAATDGITEAMNAAGEEFGGEGMERAARAALAGDPTASAEKIIAAVVAAVDQFVGSGKSDGVDDLGAAGSSAWPGDDQTLLCARWA